MRDAIELPPGIEGLEHLTDKLRQQQAPHMAHEPLPAAHIATAMLGVMDGRLSPREAVLLREIAGLADIIEQTKTEVSELSVDEIRGSHIPCATGELDAIVEHTAIATDSILESCEALDGLAGSLTPAQAAVMQDATTRIYEACSFQDITGQRITKIVKALQAIEAKVARLSRAGQVVGEALARVPAVPGTLLNGPALPQEAMGQDEIDKLLADFG